MSSEKIIVNSWNEWDPLKHVIVGKADGCCIPAPEPALDAKVPEDSDMRGQYGPRTKDTVDKANELLDNFSSILEKRGIKVDRPTPINFNQTTSTPVVNEVTEDGVTMEHSVYSHGQGQSSVEHLKILGGGHDWFQITYQGTDVNGLIWNFVSRYTKEGLRTP